MLNWIIKNMAWQSARGLGLLLDKLGPSEARTLGRSLGAKRSSKAASGMHPFMSGYRENFDGIVNTLATNGEAWLIEKTAPLNFSLALDVGANVGNWTNCFAKFHKNARVHAFEIIPGTFSILERNTNSIDARITLNKFGLSDSNGFVDVFVDPTSNVLSSVYDFSQYGGTGGIVEKCEVRVGDNYIESNNIKFIDFLKVDVEGAESAVLHGFINTLKAKKIRLIQFEYNQGAIMSHFLLRDFYDFFESVGYCVGKLYPDGIRFVDYRVEHEDFMGPNYVACLKDDLDIIDLISI